MYAACSGALPGSFSSSIHTRPRLFFTHGGRREIVLVQYADAVTFNCLP